MSEGKPMHAGMAGTIDVGGDLTVNRLGFGAMRITGDGIWGQPADRDEAKAVLRRAIELGVNFIDTADSYGPNVSEEFISEALSPYPDDLVIATKGGLERTGPGQWPANGRPEHLVEACEASLRRLGLEQIPLHQLHRPDPAESLVDLCEQEQLVFLPWAPTQDLDRNRMVQEIARRHGATPRQIVLTWLLARSPSILAIPGTASVSHLDDNVTAAAIKLTPAEVASITSNTG